MEDAKELLREVVQYTVLASTVQWVCDHPALIIALQAEVTTLNVQSFLLPKCDHSGMERRIQNLINEPDKARKRPAAVGSNKELREQLLAIT